MKVWLLEEESFYDLVVSEFKKYELFDIFELFEKLDKDSMSVYNIGESCCSILLFVEFLFESFLWWVVVGNFNLNWIFFGFFVVIFVKVVFLLGSFMKFWFFFWDFEVGWRQYVEECGCCNFKIGLILECVGFEGSFYFLWCYCGQGQEGEYYYSCVQLVLM